MRTTKAYQSIFYKWLLVDTCDPGAARICTYVLCMFVQSLSFSRRLMSNGFASGTADQSRVKAEPGTKSHDAGMSGIPCILLHFLGIGLDWIMIDVSIVWEIAANTQHILAFSCIF